MDADKEYVPLTEEEIEELFAEPDVPPPSAYHLGSNEGRCGFLEAYFWRGEEALFESVNHAWNSLAEPRKLKTIYIGMWAGTGGSGKWAIAKTLRQALSEYLDYDRRPPWGQDFPDIHELHAAAMDYFAGDFAHYQRTIQKYADILGGEPGRHAPMQSHVIEGPWRALTDA